MRLTMHSSVRAFVDAVVPTLGLHEAEHHLVLGVAGALAAAEPGARAFAATVEDDDGLALAAFMQPEKPLLLASDRDDVTRPSGLICDALCSAGSGPRHVIGAVGHAATFVAEWERRSGGSAWLGMRQRLYRLTEVRPVPPVSGAFRAATESDVDLVAQWKAEFEREALGPALHSDTRGAAERRIAAREVYLWCDPEPRTMAASARPTTHGIAVNAVYTPPAWRRRGYATACVAELSRRLLRDGFAFCVLYTDLANPTSNAIYMSAGYQPIRDFSMYSVTMESRVPA